MARHSATQVEATGLEGGMREDAGSLCADMLASLELSSSRGTCEISD